jgi:hypothetical protein
MLQRGSEKTHENPTIIDSPLKLKSIEDRGNMWCFVSEPSGIIHEIFLPRNSIGQECFDKV